MIISTYEKYELRRAIESVKNQTYKVEEIIIVDAALGDCNYNFVKDELDDSIKFVSPNMNLDEAIYSDWYSLFNIGIKYVTCNYVLVLETKDTWRNNVIEKYEETIKQNEAVDIIISPFTRKAGPLIRYSTETFDDKQMGAMAYVQFLDSPSTVLLKTVVAVNYKKVSVDDLCVSRVNEKICEVYSINYTAPRLEKIFWQQYHDLFEQKDILSAAMIYCVGAFQNDTVSKSSFSAFADNVELSVREAVEIMYGEPKVAEADMTKNEELNTVIHKKQTNYALMRDWVELKNSGRSVASNLSDRQVAKIAIYGTGKHGTILYDELKNSDIEITAWIDNNPKGSQYCDIRVILAEEVGEVALDTDMIIVTPVTEYMAIEKALKEKTSIKIVSLADLVKV